MALTPGQKAARTRVLRRMELERKAAVADRTIERTLQLVRELEPDTYSSLDAAMRAIDEIDNEWQPIRWFIEEGDGNEIGVRTGMEVDEIVHEIKAEYDDLDPDELLAKLYDEARKRTIEAVRKHLQPAFRDADAAHGNACAAVENAQIEHDTTDLDEFERDLIAAQVPIRGAS